MTPEQSTRLEQKRWLNRANSLREKIRNVIAQVLRKSPGEIQFTDFELTRQIRGRFAEEIKKNEESIVPDRSAAIELITTKLADVNCFAFLMINSCDESGMIKLNLHEAVICIDDILENQSEYFGVITHDGAAGASITVEEGTAFHFPRCVVVWNRTK